MIVFGERSAQVRVILFESFTIIVKTKKLWIDRDPDTEKVEGPGRSGIGRQERR